MSGSSGDNYCEFTEEELEDFEERDRERERILALGDGFYGIPRDKRQAKYRKWKAMQSCGVDPTNPQENSVRLVSMIEPACRV